MPTTTTTMTMATTSGNPYLNLCVAKGFAITRGEKHKQHDIQNSPPKSHKQRQHIETLLASQVRKIQPQPAHQLRPSRPLILHARHVCTHTPQNNRVWLCVEHALFACTFSLQVLHEQPQGVYTCTILRNYMLREHTHREQTLP